MSNTSAAQLRKAIDTTSTKEKFVDSYELFLASTFENSPNCEFVTKNLGSTQYKIFLTDYDTDKNLIGYKKFVQYPYDSQVFDVGDYIVINSVNWLVFAVDNQFLYNIRGKIKKCNNTLKWRDSDDNLLSYPCVIDDKINNSDLDQNKNIVIPEGGIIVYCQKNADTDTIGINKRFVFSEQAFKINAIINYSSSTFVTFIMQIENIANGDDLSNNIANNDMYNYVLNIEQDDFTQNISYTSTLSYTLELNDEVVTNSVEWLSSDVSKVTVDGSGNIELLATGSAVITCRMVDNTSVSDSVTITVDSVLPSASDTIITPDEYTVLQGNSQVYSIYRYVDNVQQADTFTITISDVPAKYYSASVANNGFTITNIQSYTENDLKITCVNNVTSSVTVYYVKLKGLW